MAQLPQTLSAVPTVEAYVRPTVLADQIDATLDRLERLDAVGRIDLVATRTWPDEVPLDTPCSDQSVLDTYREFVAWAARAGASIDPPFAVRTKHSRTTDESRTVLATPVLCLAVYDDDVLRAVYPHVDDDGNHPVAECVAALERSAARTPDPTPEATQADGELDATGPGCPDCGTAVANVQGIADCLACAWVGAVRDRPGDSRSEPTTGVLRP